MGSLRILFSNYLINVGFVAWFSAQLIKTLLVLISTKKFEAERLFGAGGMPSSHSALACSMAIGMCRKMGFDSPEFAMGVRRAAGEQAKVLNKMVFDFSDLWGKPDREKKPPQGDGEENEKSILGDKALKEYLGHTPLEVLGGALLGILVAMMIKVT